MRRLPPLLLLAPLLAARAAGAQAPAPARVLVLVDTSGSMTFHVADANPAGGDGDTASLFTDALQANKNYYPGTSLGGGNYDGVNSRIYAAKSAWRDGLYSTGDISPGLLRYVASGACPNATYCCTPSNSTRGPCVCDPDYINNPGGAACPAGADGLITWAGGCGPVNGSGQATAGGVVLADPAAAGSFAGALKWVDNVEDFRASVAGVANNPELRAAGGSPIAGAARSALSWYAAIRNGAADPWIDCRPYAFVYLTDAVDSCEVSPSNPATAPVAAVQALYNANPANPVKTYVIGIGPLAAGDQAILNNMAAAGGTGSARFVASAAQARLAVADVIGRSIKGELCNGVDDNCNGQADEGFSLGQACSVGVGACRATGVRVCAGDQLSAVCPVTPGTPTPEICDGQDNNCNGFTDEGGVCQ